MLKKIISVPSFLKVLIINLTFNGNYTFDKYIVHAAV